MRCEEFYKEFLSLYNTGYVEKYLTTQCSRSTRESFIVINDNRKKVSIAIFFEESHKDDERIYAEFKKVGRMLAWNLKTSEEKVDKEKITTILMMILKGKHSAGPQRIFFPKTWSHYLSAVILKRCSHRFRRCAFFIEVTKDGRNEKSVLI